MHFTMYPLALHISYVEQERMTPHDDSPPHDMHDTLTRTRAWAREEVRYSQNQMLVARALTGSRSFQLQRVDNATSSEALRDALQVGDFEKKDHDAFFQGPNNEDFVSSNATFSLFWAMATVTLSMLPCARVVRLATRSVLRSNWGPWPFFVVLLLLLNPTTLVGALDVGPTDPNWRSSVEAAPSGTTVSFRPGLYHGCNVSVPAGAPDRKL